MNRHETLSPVSPARHARRLRAVPSAVALALVVIVPNLFFAAQASALEVFAGDPVDPGTGLAYPVMPGLPLVLPGPDHQLGTVDDIVNNSITGDVDLVIRVGTIAATAIPPPAGASGGPSVTTVVVGGGTTGVGNETPFTVMLSDGSGNPPYGNVISSTELDSRPVAVYAFADLDGDGHIGPTAAGDAAANALRLQETTAFLGRQVGAFSHSRLQASIGLSVGAPASIGGLDVALVAAGYTGANTNILFSDGTMILTRWPFFPPLDPLYVLDLTNPHPPDPAFPSQLEFDITKNWLPAPNDPVFGTPFAIPVDGSEATTDHVKVVSGSAVSAQFFVPASGATFLARSSERIRVAPPVAGPGRALVQTPDRIVLADIAAHQDLRVLPVDLLSNVADLAGNLDVVVQARGQLAIASPDTDFDPTTETVVLASAAGATINVGATGPDGGRLELLVAGAVVASLPVAVGATSDSDGDTVVDDGNASGIGGDKPCDSATSACDDNCPYTLNPSQLDSDHNGIGDCCDGTCATHPQLAGCSECASATPPVVGAITSSRVRAKALGGTGSDTLAVRLSFTLPDAASDTPETLGISLAITQSGKGGYLGDVTGIARDHTRSLPWYSYADPSAAHGGVTQARFVRVSATRFRATLRAEGVSLVDLGVGTGTLTLSIGGEVPFDEDDIVSIALRCTGGGPVVHCKKQ